jgi:hypothetical protein
MVAYLLLLMLSVVKYRGVIQGLLQNSDRCQWQIRLAEAGQNG